MSRGELNPGYRQRVGYQAALLGGMALLAGTTLLIGDLQTREPIAAREAENLQRNLDQVIPPGRRTNDASTSRITITDAEGREHTIWREFRGNAPSAVAFEWTGQGYAGDIDLLLGLDTDGTVLGVRVLRHSETPGLGDRIEVERDDWILGFDGRSLANTPPKDWQVRKDGGDFDQFTGATITARAVVEAVHEALRFHERHRDAIYSAPRPDPDHATVEE